MHTLHTLACVTLCLHTCMHTSLVLPTCSLSVVLFLSGTLKHSTHKYMKSFFSIKFHIEVNISDILSLFEHFQHFFPPFDTCIVVKILKIEVDFEYNFFKFDKNSSHLVMHTHKHTPAHAQHKNTWNPYLDKWERESPRRRRFRHWWCMWVSHDHLRHNQGHSCTAHCLPLQIFLHHLAPLWVGHQGFHKMNCAVLQKTTEKEKDEGFYQFCFGINLIKILKYTFFYLSHHSDNMLSPFFIVIHVIQSVRSHTRLTKQTINFNQSGWTF